jgi:hypothetical protein
MGGETEVKKKRPKHSLRISQRFLSLTRARLEEKNMLFSDDIISATLDTPTRPFTIKEMRAIIKNLNPKKMAGNDFITNEILQNLPKMGIKYITQLYYAVVRQGIFPL